MCGIVGVFDFAGENPESSGIVKSMAETIRHRGPDCGGFVQLGRCTFGFQRLSIVDIDAPSPPLPNEDKSVWTMANAEIYNSGEIRPRLEKKGHAFRTDVDTEVIPHLWEELGPDLVQQLNGMFAIAVWDTKKQSLMLARDRAGEKPLFYWHDSRQLVFASELRALLAHPAVPRAVDPVALRRFLLHGFFPAPGCPIADIKKLPAGHQLLVQDGKLELRRYWDLADHYSQPKLTGSVGEVAEDLDQRIAHSVTYRRRSDVPVGVFLSGGIDSSCILSHLSEQVGAGVQTFTLGHDDLSFDESRFARKTAEYFDAEFNELILSEGDLEKGLQMVAAGFDEPLGDASIIPTLLLSHFARQKVKVVLSGEGADEMFAGYPTYLGNRFVGAYKKMPAALRRGLLKAVSALMPVSMGNVGMDYMLQLFAEGAESELIERHHTWFGSIPPKLHQGLLSERVWEHLQEDDPFGSARAIFSGSTFPDSLAKVLYSDFSLYLQDDLLTKVDRSTMLASLEARAPFLDHELLEYVARIPSSMKVSGLTTKAILKRAVKHRLPKEVLKQRKRGFNIPFSRWLLNGMGDKMAERFSEERVRERGLFNHQGIKQLLDEHMSRRADHRKPLFALLAFDMWCDSFYDAGEEIPVAICQTDDNEIRKDNTDSGGGTVPVVPRSA
jgi:asparagine synthase (glutamine-hydrolysing)